MQLRFSKAWLVLLLAVIFGLGLYLPELAAIAFSRVSRITSLTVKAADQSLSIVALPIVSGPAALLDSEGLHGHFVFHANPFERNYSLLIPRFSGAITVWANREEVARLRTPESVVPYAGFDPLIIYIPVAVMTPQVRIDIEIRPDGLGRYAIAPVLVGPSYDVDSYYALLTSMSVDIQTVITSLCIATILFGALLWAGTRDRTYLYFTLVSTLLMFQTRLNSMLSSNGLTWIEAIIINVVLFAFFWSLAICVLSMINRLTKNSIAVSLLVTGLCLLLVVIAFYQKNTQILLIPWAINILTLLVLAGYLCSRAPASTRFVGLGLSAVIGLVGMFSVIDFVGLGISHSRYGEPLLTRLGGPPILAILFLFSFDRFMKANLALKSLNDVLSDRMHAAESRMRELYSDLYQKQRAVAVQEERERLMKDIHDGLGSHLISAMVIAQNSNEVPRLVVGALEDCLTELRLSIDSLESDDQTLVAILANLRNRLTPVLEHAGIDLQWRVRPMDGDLGMSSQTVRNVLRILQEGFTNIFKHSGATVVTVRCGIYRCHYWVLLRSHGFARGQSGRLFDQIHSGGNGIPNMQARARLMGGKLRLRLFDPPNCPSSSLRLVWPVSDLQAKGQDLTHLMV